MPDTYMLSYSGAKVDDNIGQVDANESAIGNLSNLTTTEKGSLVGALNEVNAKAPSIATISSVGVVKPDGSSITIDGSGALSASYGGFSMTEVWTNPNPTSSFALTQTLSIDLSGYKAIAIYFTYSTASVGDRFGGLYPIGFPDSVIIYTYAGSAEASRTISSISSSGITFSAGTNSNNIIPQRIYGVK